MCINDYEMSFKCVEYFFVKLLNFYNIKPKALPDTLARTSAVTVYLLI